MLSSKEMIGVLSAQLYILEGKRDGLELRIHALQARLGAEIETYREQIHIELVSERRKVLMNTEGLMVRTPLGEWCIYDFKNEVVIYCKDDQYPTEEEMAQNMVKMPVIQAHAIRRAKGLPMPLPPVPVVVRE